MDYSVTPTRSSCKMSSSLKEKLRKLGRYHGSQIPLPNKNSPSALETLSPSFSSCNPLTLSSFKKANLTKITASTHSSDEITDLCLINESTKESSTSSKSPSTLKDNDDDEEEWASNRKALNEMVGEWKKKEKIYEENLRKLTLVKVYQSKNNLFELEHLITTWRTACQKAIYDLLARYQDPKPSFGQLLKFMDINDKLVGYDEENDAFI